MSKELLNALDALETEKGIKKEVVIDALEQALVSAYKRNYDKAQNVEVEFDKRKGDIKVYSVKEVVNNVFDSRLEVNLEDALEINKAYEVGDTIRFEVTPRDFGRIAAQTAKQVIMQRVREEERQMIYDQYSKYENEIVSGEVERHDSRYIYVNLGNVEAVLSKKDQVPGEVYKSHDRIKVYIYKVVDPSANNNEPEVENKDGKKRRKNRGPQVYVSRSHPDLLKRLFENEVPEIFDGTVEIKSIAREAGDRAKVAVYSAEEGVDPIGTCVGPRGERVQAIVNELNGEKMDIIEWSEDPAKYISNALNPANIVEVRFDPENERVCTVIVPDDQLSLAIGKRGQNARLAAHLTGYKIDIKSESDMAALEANAELADEAEVSVETTEE
ncbi:transcription termination factor NusA [Ligilactobacillus animalis]|uniref:transcription termination factor NusA n=1 Tax=Ligilactobacillus animalis TaxID=1605 RepID=UPI000824A557|nr:transcription termination factor NusA [Ligilactobacillus animalis]MDO5882772.1 transcription termination factor NusA [Ligilactobacillus animalis]MDQ2233579.1 transcription termination factor NusA [Ligilactobacillus animalis]MDU1488170.1 transcription termination factor NusA [Ligilactobacillus animalis]MDU3186821.1 transcription termination factor NusA [Ligilactobacillus animalis]MDU8986010.1 transcription termination factor NusA [Ligilactobacillus animalis]